MTHRHASTTAQIWRWPMLIGALSAIGLVSALFSDGGWADHVANTCLAMPVLVGGWFGWGRRSKS